MSALDLLDLPWAVICGPRTGRDGPVTVWCVYAGQVVVAVSDRPSRAVTAATREALHRVVVSIPGAPAPIDLDAIVASLRRVP